MSRLLSSKPPLLDGRAAEDFIAGATVAPAGRPRAAAETVRLTATMPATDAAALESVGRRALDGGLLQLADAGNKSYLMQLAARALSALPDEALRDLIVETPALRNAR